MNNNIKPTQTLMQPTQNTIEEIFNAYIALVSTNIEAWSDLLAEDAVVELPYASALGVPPRLESKSGIYNYLKPVMSQMQNLAFTNVRKYPTLNPDVLLAEVHGEAVITATGHHYQQDYVIRMEVADGKIVHIREYSNPVPAMDAFGINHPILNARS